MNFSRMRDIDWFQDWGVFWREIGGKKMALCEGLSKRQISLSGGHAACSQRWLCGSLVCQQKDEMVVRGEADFAGEPVLGNDTKFSSDGLHGHLLAVASDEGCVSFLDTRKLLSEATISKITCHKNTINSIAWISGGTKLLTGSGDQTVGLWDVVGGAQLESFKFHSSSIKSVDSKKDEPSIFVSSSHGGRICVWDMRCSSASKRPINVVHNAHMPPEKTAAVRRRTNSASHASNTSVMSAVFYEDSKIASVGSADRMVKLWDLRRNYSNMKAEFPRAWFCFQPMTKGFTSLVVDSRQSCLYASSRDNRIYRYMYNGTSSQPVAAFSGATISTFYVRASLSPDDRFLLSGSSCGNGFVWEVDQPHARPLVLNNSSADGGEVMGVAWCRTMDKVVMTNYDCKVRLWRVRRGRSQPRPPDITGTCEEDTREIEVYTPPPPPKMTTPTHKAVVTTRTPLHPLNLDLSGSRKRRKSSTTPPSTPTLHKYFKPAVK